MKVDHLKIQTEEENIFNSIIETPRCSRNKYSYNPEDHLFELKKVLPLGMVFPFDFGFLPSTKADDGDPLDVLILMEEPCFCGCKVEVRLIGVIEAFQIEDKKKERNDRIVAAAVHSRQHENLNSIKHLDKQVICEIEHFFTSYNQLENRKFEIIDYAGPKSALKLIEKGHKEFLSDL
jgi:inorganic pyrophosphatase